MTARRRAGVLVAFIAVLSMAIEVSSGAAILPRLGAPSVTVPRLAPAERVGVGPKASTASLSVPGVVAPKVSAPSVALPVPRLPPVSVPSAPRVQAPSVPSPIKPPSISAPSVPRLSVSPPLKLPSAAPSVPLPAPSVHLSAPSVHVPLLSTRSAANRLLGGILAPLSGGLTAPGQPGRGGTASSAPGSASTAPGASASAGGSPASSQIAGRVSGISGISRLPTGLPGDFAALLAAARSGGGYATAIRATEISQRRLRQLVAGSIACLSTLPPEARSVLLMRAGLRGAPLTSAMVAARLGLSSAAERVLEGVAILSLEQAHGSCGGDSASAFGFGVPGQSFAGSAFVSLGGATAAAQGPPAQAVSAASAKAGGSAAALPDLPLANAVISALSHEGTSTFPLILGTLALLAALVTAAGFRSSTQRRRIATVLTDYSEQDPSGFYLRLAAVGEQLSEQAPDETDRRASEPEPAVDHRDALGRG